MRIKDILIVTGKLSLFIFIVIMQSIGVMIMWYVVGGKDYWGMFGVFIFTAISGIILTELVLGVLCIVSDESREDILGIRNEKED